MAFKGIVSDPFRTIFTQALTPRTTTTYIPLDVGSDVSKMVVSVVVSAVSGTTPTLVAALQQREPTGTYWYTVVQTGSITTTGVFTMQIPADFPVGGDMQVALVIGGTTPSFTCAVGAQGR